MLDADVLARSAAQQISQVGRGQESVLGHSRNFLRYATLRQARGGQRGKGRLVALLPVPQGSGRL